MIDFCGGSYVKISIALCWVELAHGTAVLRPAEPPTLSPSRGHLSLDRGWVLNNLAVPSHISFLLTCTIFRQRQSTVSAGPVVRGNAAISICSCVSPSEV